MLILVRLNLCGWSGLQRILGCEKKGLCSIGSTLTTTLYLLKNKDDTNTNVVSRHFLHTSRSCSKYFPHPDPLEAEKLLQYYPEPVKLVEDLLRPLISVCPSSQPCLSFKPYLKATIWKATLRFTDPFPFTVVGCADCYEQAKTNVYLQACQMFWYLGLVRRSDKKVVPARETVQSLISKLSKDNFKIFKQFKIRSDQLNINDQRKWRSTLEIFLPCHIMVSAICDTPSGAEHKCYLLVIIKLKWLGFLNTYSNDLQPYSRMRLPVALKNDNFDYHIYFDASNVGFGAYFFAPNSSDVNWFHENWPDFLEEEIKGNRLRDSTFMELYAMVSAFYTWKHKFCDKSVLCYSDNMSVVTMVNDGLHLMGKHSRYEKLFKILKGVSHTYGISLGAKHICRKNNMAADFLSKSKVDKFREIVPNTREQSKKTKKLLFCLPLK